MGIWFFFFFSGSGVFFFFQSLLPKASFLLGIQFYGRHVTPWLAKMAENSVLYVFYLHSFSQRDTDTQACVCQHFTFSVWCLNGLTEGSAELSLPFCWAGVGKKEKGKMDG